MCLDLTLPNSLIIFMQASVANGSTDGTTDCDNQRLSDSELLDTVGAVCIDMNGHIVSAVSSGGIILKQPGRLGQVNTCTILSWDIVQY